MWVVEGVRTAGGKAFNTVFSALDLPYGSGFLGTDKWSSLSISTSIGTESRLTLQPLLEMY